MVTAAAGSDAAVVLVDITKLDLRTRPVALLPQTRRHTLLAQLLRVPGIVFAINKLDAVDDPAGRLRGGARGAARRSPHRPGIEVAGIVPVSALRGDNVTRPLDVRVVRRPSLLQLLESLPAASEPASGALSLPVQYVARQGATTPRPRTAASATSVARSGAASRAAASRPAMRSRCSRAANAPWWPTCCWPAARSTTPPPDSRSASCSTASSTSRAATGSRRPVRSGPTQRFEATLAWLDTEPAVVGRRYQVRHGNRWVQARIAAIESRLDIRTLRPPTSADRSRSTRSASVVVETQQPLPLAPYAANRVGGALIVVDPATHRTSGALLVGD